jgi:SAM-dependent methyltransferase
MNDLTTSLEKHYAEWPPVERIFEGLRRKGVDLANVRPQDLYPYDQSHAGGIEATRALAARARIERQSVVVDIGCGIGGAARFLRSEFACQVVGVDLTAARLRTAHDFNRMVGINRGIDLLVADAARLPLPNNFAHVIWTQHVTMNLAGHKSFLQECARVLKPGGRVAAHEWFVTSPKSAPCVLPFPMPWAPGPELNHAIRADEFLGLLREQGFSPESENVTAAMLEALRSDVQALTMRNAPEQRVAARANLLEAAGGGLLQCLMITASKAS